MWFPSQMGRIAAKPFMLFSALMLIKIYLVRYFIWGTTELWAALLAGLPSVWVFFCLAEWLFAKRKFYAYLVLDFLISAVYIAVTIFYKYFGVIPTYQVLKQIGQVSEVKGSVFSLMHASFLFLFADIGLFILFLSSSRAFRKWIENGKAIARIRGNGVVLSLSIVLSLFSMWLNKDIVNELRQAEVMDILNYEVFAAVASAKEVQGDPTEVTQKTIDELKHLETGETSTPLHWAQAKGKNVIIIQMEAFQNFLIDLKLDGKEVTPNINRLAKASYYFPRFYQQVGQGNTSDSEFVVNTSLYVPKHDAATMVYSNKQLPSMPKIFGANGYQTATFHTNDVQFWNRNNLYKALGWQKYYDDDFFGNDDIVMFGASDEILYQKTAPELLKMQQSGKPFYVQILSMSGHHPFNLPKRKNNMKLPQRFENTLVGDYIRAQNYADKALGQFIDELKRNGVWDNSVVVVYGDHLGLPKYTLNAREKGLMKEIYGREYDVQDMLNIPLIISAPGATPERFPQLGGQIDLFPTIANLLGISIQGQIHFGQDLLNNDTNVLPERYYLPSGSLITDNGIFVPGNGYEDGESYSFASGKTTKPAATRQQFDEALRLLRLPDSYVRNLPDRKEN
ncbi:LTA synthase family protein [Cohnella algarum]|uniref:LTA synthase family protein n=1 Tax=Cohnella algarum TaxID=2044859 RepID=UPI001966D6D2|nr:LTA synthase family protein [Cohnella algarum]MBN2981786.1 LTA synthase family protein [Cohnella algarum]